MFIVKQNFAPFTENHGNVRLTSSFERPSPTAGYGENDAANRRQCDSEGEDCGRYDAAGCGGPTSCSSHLRIELSFDILV